MIFVHGSYSLCGDFATAADKLAAFLMILTKGEGSGMGYFRTIMARV
jgi:hypothetical protein